MENLFSAFILLFFVILPLVAIFSFTSKVTSGIYYWADSQHPQETYDYTEQRASPKTTTPLIKDSPLVLKYPLAKSDKNKMEDYLGYSLEYEDSSEFKNFLDNNDFDVREHLKVKKG
jgi:hypothetical protein